MANAEIDYGEKIERIESALLNPQAALKQIGAIMVAESQLAFKQQKFGRDVWQPRAPINVFGIIGDFAQGKKEPPKRRFETTPALRDTGRLSASIAFAIKDRYTVEVGTNLDYAAMHQEGGQTKSAKITKDLRKRFWVWLKKQTAARKKALGWVLNKKFIGKEIPGNVPKRPFVGVTQETLEDVEEIVGVKIFEVK